MKQETQELIEKIMKSKDDSSVFDELKKEIVLSNNLESFGILNYFLFMNEKKILNPDFSYISLLENGFEFPYIDKSFYHLIQNIIPTEKERLKSKIYRKVIESFFMLDQGYSQFKPISLEELNSIKDNNGFYTNLTLFFNNLKILKLNNITLNLYVHEFALLNNEKINDKTLNLILNFIEENAEYNPKQKKALLLRLLCFYKQLNIESFIKVLDLIESNDISNKYIQTLHYADDLPMFYKEVIYERFFSTKYSLQQANLNKSQEQKIRDFYFVETEEEIKSIKSMVRSLFVFNNLNEKNQDIKHILESLISSSEIISNNSLNNEKNVPKLYEWVSLEKINNMSIGNSENSEHVKKIVDKIKDNRLKPKISISKEQIEAFNKLKEEMPNFSEVIDHFLGQVKLNILNKNKFSFKPILLLGEPGLGKNYIVEQLAQILHTGYNFIDFGSTSASFVIKGGSRQWRDAKEGKILNAMVNSNTINPIVLLDEIDKNSSGKNYSPDVVLYQLLEKQNARTFEDEFLELSFDASTIIYFCIANSLENIPIPIQNRLEIFTIEKLDKDSNRKLVQNIYNKLISEYSIFSEELDEEILSFLEDKTPRDITNYLQKIIGYSISQVDFNNMEDSQDSIKVKFIKGNSLKKKKIGFVN